MDDDDDNLYQFSLFYWQLNLSYLSYGILGVFRTRKFLRRYVYYEKYEYFLFPTVHSLFIKTASISIYSAGLIQPPI